MDELIRLSKKAANEWRNTDAYYQAAVLIDSLCERLEKIENRNPQTNADRIRGMRDEGLAKVFTAAVASGCPPKMDWDCAKDKNGWDACDACWCKWLKQPAEET